VDGFVPSAVSPGKGLVRCNEAKSSWTGTGSHGFVISPKLNQWSRVDISLDIIEEAYSLPETFHRDPADRIIVATARALNGPVVTADEKTLGYPPRRQDLVTWPGGDPPGNVNIDRSTIGLRLCWPASSSSRTDSKTA